MAALATAVSAFEALSGAITAQISDARPFSEIWGWNQPAITAVELARYPERVATRLRSLNEKSLSEDFVELLPQLESRARWVTANTVPNMPGGNAHMGVAVIRELCEFAEESMPPLPPPVASVDWRAVENKKQLPQSLVRRLQSLEAQLERLEPRVSSAAQDMKTIMEAKTAAEDLPVTLTELDKLKGELEEAKETIVGTKKDAGEAGTKVDQILTDLEQKQKDAAEVLKQLGISQRAATTKGLSSAFRWKAISLNATLVLWVVGLAAALIGGGVVAHVRFLDLQALIVDRNVATERLWMQTLLALAGVGGPIWFAWIATKQIGQRFRMAEDYAYKATVAKAYEGFRLEAVRVNPELENRLFLNAVTRLEEAPLRHVEAVSHGGPAHELLQSEVVQRLASTVPELRAVLERVYGSAALLLDVPSKAQDADKKSRASDPD